METPDLPAQNVPAPAELNAALLRSLIDHGSDAVLVVEAAGMRLVDVNLNALQMLGFRRDELIGTELSRVECSLLDVFFWDELSQGAGFEGLRIAETEWMRSDGSTFQVEKRVLCHGSGASRFWIIYAQDLTRQKQLEQQQLQLVSQLQSSLESTAEGILAVNLSGRIVNFNRRFAQMWGLAEEQLADQNEQLMWSHLKSVLQNASVLEQVLMQTRNELHAETEDLLALQDGRYFILVSKPEFLRDMLIGRVFSVRDITPMKKIETDLLQARDLAELASREKSRMLDALRVSESRLRRVVNSSLIGIMQGDMSGNISEANDVLLTLLGLEPGVTDPKKLNWLNLTTADSHAAYQLALNRLGNSGQSEPFEMELQGGAGNPVPVMVGLARLEGSDTEWVGFVLDLTRQREADRVKSDFIAMVSHELRTPLTSIHGSLSLLNSGVLGALPDAARNLVEIALKNSKRLGTLVNDLLDMEKLASGKMQLALERVDLVNALKMSVEANLPYAHGLKVQYRLTEYPAHAAWACADGNRLLQVMANLLSNAAKFSPEGGEVQVRILEQPGMYRVEVEDHGPGIPLEFRDRIFKKFAQADHGDTRRQGGTGLGLNITQSLIEKMGGQIGFDSQIGKGTVFWFTLMAHAGAQLIDPDRIGQ